MVWTSGKQGGRIGYQNSVETTRGRRGRQMLPWKDVVEKNMRASGMVKEDEEDGT